MATGIEDRDGIFKGTERVMAALCHRMTHTSGSGWVRVSHCLVDAPVDQTCSATNIDMCEISMRDSLIGTSLKCAPLECFGNF